jgi:hypothetical protein
MSNIEQQNPFVTDDIITLYNSQAWENVDLKKTNRRVTSTGNKILENLYRVQDLYYDIIKSMHRKLRELFIHDEDAFNNALNTLLDRADNKIRSNSQGTMYVNIGDKVTFMGTAREYEKFFNTTKRIYNSILRLIVKELIDTTQNKAFKEADKSIKFDDTNG